MLVNLNIMVVCVFGKCLRTHTHTSRDRYKESNTQTPLQLLNFFPSFHQQVGVHEELIHLRINKKI